MRKTLFRIFVSLNVFIMGKISYGVEPWIISNLAAKPTKKFVQSDFVGLKRMGKPELLPLLLIASI